MNHYIALGVSKERLLWAKKQIADITAIRDEPDVPRK